MIYQLVFEQDSLSSKPKPASECRKRFMRRWRQRRGALVRCCRQICSEALPVLRQATIYAILHFTMIKRRHCLEGQYVDTMEVLRKLSNLIEHSPNLRKLKLSVSGSCNGREWRWTSVCHPHDDSYDEEGCEAINDASSDCEDGANDGSQAGNQLERADDAVDEMEEVPAEIETPKLVLRPSSHQRAPTPQHMNQALPHKDDRRAYMCALLVVLLVLSNETGTTWSSHEI